MRMRMSKTSLSEQLHFIISTVFSSEECYDPVLDSDIGIWLVDIN